MRRFATVWAVIVFASACGGSPSNTPAASPPPPPPSPVPAAVALPPPMTAQAFAAAASPCGGPKLRVHFYDVAQALSALVDLPDGHHILVDTGDASNQPGCGVPCKTAHEHLVAQLGTDLGSSPIDMLWITHQHADHIGGALDLLEHFSAKTYVDNGRDLTVSEIARTHQEVKAKGIPATVVEPGHEAIALVQAGDARITAIAPSSWLPSCKTDRNECSILLRIDYCASSVLFTGDAEVEEEALLDPHGSATLLQVGHHGSDTSSGPALLAKVKPRYAVISAGKEGEGMNRTYCHPRSSTVKAVTQALGGPGAKTVRGFDARVACKGASDSDWSDVPASDNLWATERDGDVVLSTTGDGTFTRE